MEVASKALEQTSVCLTFDGKKINQGLTENTGDIDLLGFEEEEEQKNLIYRQTEILYRRELWVFDGGTQG
jgi:hypothetical protein